MKTYEGKILREWIDWIETEGVLLAKEERDVRVTHGFQVQNFGSLQSVLPGKAQIVILTYDAPGTLVHSITIPASSLLKIEVLRTRRLRPDRAYAQMRKMVQLTIPTSYPIEDTCP